MPSGCIQTLKDLIRHTLAATWALQNWQGNVFSAEELKARIFDEALPPPAPDSVLADSGEDYSPAELDQLRPYAIVYKGPSLSIEAVAEPGGVLLAPSIFVVELTQSLPKGLERRPDEADKLFEETIGALLWTGDPNKPGLVELRARKHEGYLDWLSIEAQGPVWPEITEGAAYGDHQKYFLFVTVGYRS